MNKAWNQFESPTFDVPGPEEDMLSAPLYVIDGDVMTLGMDVLCSTGIEADWLDLVPRGAFFVWDPASLAPAYADPMNFGIVTELPWASESSGYHLAAISGLWVGRDFRDQAVLLRADVPLAGDSLLRDAANGSPQDDLEVASRTDLDIAADVCEQIQAWHGCPPDAAVRATIDVIRAWHAYGHVWHCPFESSHGILLVNRHAWDVGQEAARATAKALGDYAPDAFDGVMVERHGISMSLLAAIFALREHPEIVEGTDDDVSAASLPRKERQRLVRHGIDPDHALSRVTTIHLRKPSHVRGRRDGDGAEGDARHVDWSCRWIVHGHFRQQPYGPGGSLRKRIWIPPYVKGPADKPLRSDLMHDIRILP